MYPRFNGSPSQAFHLRAAVAGTLVGLSFAGLPAFAQFGVNQGAHPNAVVEGTEFVVTRQDGSRLAQDELKGTVLVMTVNGAGPLLIAIQGSTPRPNDSMAPEADKRIGKDMVWINDLPELRTYDVTVYDQATLSWRPYCVKLDTDTENPQAIPIRGRFDATGGYYRGDGMVLGCTNDPIGKCLRMGYRPGRTHTDQYEPYLRTCIRAVRADYCGTGQSHTRVGELIEIFDRLPIQLPPAGYYNTSGAIIDPSPKVEEVTDPLTGRKVPMAFEAAWTPGGAACIDHTRLPETTLRQIENECPDRLFQRTGVPHLSLAVPILGADKPIPGHSTPVTVKPTKPPGACTWLETVDDPGVLMFNRSRAHKP